MIILKHETGSLEAKKQGRGSGGKLQDHHAWVRQRLAVNGDLTLDELCVELEERHVSVHRASVGRLLHRLGLSHKKKPSGQ
jgi:transposase